MGTDTIIQVPKAAYRHGGFFVQLEVTSRCNANCKYCARGDIIKKGIRRLGDIRLDTIDKVLPDLLPLRKLALKPNKKFLLSFGGLGEPLLHKELPEIVRRVRALGSQVIIRLNTNGALLEGARADWVLRSGIDILNYSLDFADAKAYAKYCDLSFQKIEGNLIRFLALKGNRLPRVDIRTVNFDENLPFATVKGKWAKHLNANDKVVLAGFTNWAGLVDRCTYVQKAPATRSRICHRLWDQLSVTLDGDVFACCLGVAVSTDSALWLGNINEARLPVLYNSKRLAQLRVMHAAGEYPAPCDACDSAGKMK